MKKQIFFALAIFFTVLSVSAATLIQEGGEDSTSYFNALLLTFAAYVPTVLIVTQFFKTKVLGVEDGGAKWLSWVVAVVLAAVANLLQLGFFAEYTIWASLGIGVIGGLTANGFFDTTLGGYFAGLFKKKAV